MTVQRNIQRSRDDQGGLTEVREGDIMNRRLYAGNLHFEVTDAALRELFARAGGVEQAEVLKDRWTGMSRGFGFVEMITAEDAETAVAELDGAQYMNRTLRVAMAKPRTSPRSTREAAGE